MAVFPEGVDVDAASRDQIVIVQHGFGPASFSFGIDTVSRAAHDCRQRQHHIDTARADSRGRYAEDDRRRLVLGGYNPSARLPPFVVEDEPGLRRVARRILESAGYTVLVAADGRMGVRGNCRALGPAARQFVLPTAVSCCLSA